MPDTVYSATVASELADILRRLTALEVHRPGAMTLLGSTNVGSNSHGFFASGGDAFNCMTECNSPTFTLLRPTPILVVGVIAGFYGNAGTSSYVIARVSILQSNAQTTPSLDWQGNQMQGNGAWQTVGSGLANGTNVLCYVVPAGTYFASWGYACNGGATTTFNYQATELDVFQLAG